MAGEHWEEFTPSEGVDKDRSIVVADRYEVPRMDIPSYFSDEFWDAYRVWQNYRTFGWPFAGGWAEQPARVYDLIRCLEIESRKVKRAGT